MGKMPTVWARMLLFRRMKEVVSIIEQGPYEMKLQVELYQKNHFRRHIQIREPESGHSPLLSGAKAAKVLWAETKMPRAKARRDRAFLSCIELRAISAVRGGTRGSARRRGSSCGRGELSRTCVRRSPRSEPRSAALAPLVASAARARARLDFSIIMRAHARARGRRRCSLSTLPECSSGHGAGAALARVGEQNAE